VARRKVTYRLYPTPKQKESMEGMRVAHQRLYNAALEGRIWAYRAKGESVGFAQQCRELTQLRAESPEYREINCQSSQVTLKRLELAFQAFFRRSRKGLKPGFPRYKSVKRYPGWGYKKHGDGWRLLAGKGQRNGRVRLAGVGLVSIRGRARTEGTPKTMEVQLKNGKWYASVTLDCAPERECGTRAAGMDWGLETFATIAFDDGSFQAIENPRHLKRSLGKLKSAQKSLSRKKRGSHNREKARRKVACIHERVANQRRDFSHKTSSALVADARLIATEKLNIKAMSSSAKGTKDKPGKRVRQKAGLNRSILDTSPATWLQMLRYKAEEAGIEWVDVPTRRVKPSQTCHLCGRQAKKPLSERVHKCVCGAYCGRDENAARVMLNWAIDALGREPARCGAQMSCALKHETPSAALCVQVE
jgi:putative transposase